MTIAVCASLHAHYQILQVERELIALGFKVLLPIGTKKIKSGEWDLKRLGWHKRQFKSAAITMHFEAIKKADAILVVNPTKLAVKNYIGGNTLMEMGFAYYLKKPIYIINDIPKNMLYTEEIIGVRPIVLRGNLRKIKKNYSPERSRGIDISTH